MAAFSQLDTAARVRDVVRKVASRVVDIEVSTPLVGRVTAIDLVHLKAMVWFAGDPNPIQVALFSSVIPGQSEAGFPTDQPSNGLVGYGSLVACESLNGTLYVTQVLTGGQFSFDFDMLNQGMIAQMFYDEVQGGVQPLNGLKATEEILMQLPSITNGQAVEFGPFINTYDGGEAMGPMWLDADVFEQLEGSAKSYRANSYLKFETGGGSIGAGPDRWVRIIPDVETNAMGVSDRNSDWHFEVASKVTKYGTTPQGLVKTEIWFRIVADSLTNAFVQPFVRIRSPWLHKARAVDGTEKFVCTTVVNPTAAVGFVGFHSSNGSGVFTIDNSKYRDTFTRSVSSGLGTMSDFPSGYTIGSPASDYNVGGTAATLTMSPVNSEKTVDITSNTVMGRDQDTLAVISIDQVATGADIFLEFRHRKTASNNYYFVRAAFKVGGNVDLSILKNVAGTITSLDSQTNALSGTHAANEQLNVRYQVKDGKIRAKIWRVNTAPPKRWQVVITDASITATGGWQFSAIASTGNTNTTPHASLHNLEVSNNFTGVRNNGKWHTGPWRNGPLRLGSDLQRTMMLEGEFIWDGSNISWTGEIFLGGVGANRNGLIDARHYITCPFSTNYQFPVYGGYSINSVTATANGIPLATGQSLYCAIPPGEWEQDLQPYLFIVDGTNTINFDDSNRLWQYSLPEWSVLIAKRIPPYPDKNVNNLGTMPIKLGTGGWLDNWHNIGVGSEPAFGTNWANQAGWRSVGFRKVDPGHVELKGAADYTSTIAAPTAAIFTLPAGYRPGNSMYFAVPAIPATAATAPVMRGMQISSNGQIQVTSYVGTIDPGPIPLEGIIFSVSG